jgi:hypothetical protein
VLCCQLVDYKNERDRVLRIRGIDFENFVEMLKPERDLIVKEDEHVRDAAQVLTVI